MAGLESSQSQSSPKWRGRQMQSDDDSATSRARTAKKKQEASKRLVLKESGGATYVAGASARPLRGKRGKLPPLSTKGSDKDHLRIISQTAISVKKW
jgi:hypothetical protein